MQIFVTDPNPMTSAHNLWANPVRAMKMITESQQILACALVHLECEQTLRKVDGEPFRTPKSRLNHPVVRWAGRNRTNFVWVVCHLIALYLEYRVRGGEAFVNVPGNLNRLLDIVEGWGPGPVGEPVEFLNFAKAADKGLDFTHVRDPFEAYQRFLSAQAKEVRS